MLLGPYSGTIIHPCGMSGGRMQFAPTGTRPNFAAPAGAAPTRGQSFIPAGCLGGECNSPLHVPGKLRCPRRGRPYTGTRQTWQASLMPRPRSPDHSSLWDVWGANAIHPYTGTIIHPCGMSGGRMLLRPYTGTIIHPCGMSGGRIRYAPTRVPGQTSPASADAPRQGPPLMPPSGRGIKKAGRASQQIRPTFKKN